MEHQMAETRCQRTPGGRNIRGAFIKICDGICVHEKPAYTGVLSHRKNIMLIEIDGDPIAVPYGEDIDGDIKERPPEIDNGACLVKLAENRVYKGEIYMGFEVYNNLP